MVQNPKCTKEDRAKNRSFSHCYAQDTLSLRMRTSVQKGTYLEILQIHFLSQLQENFHISKTIVKIISSPKKKSK